MTNLIEPTKIEPQEANALSILAGMPALHRPKYGKSSYDRYVEMGWLKSDFTKRIGQALVGLIPDHELNQAESEIVENYRRWIDRNRKSYEARKERRQLLRYQSRVRYRKPIA